VDESIAFVGGIDIAFNRYDDNHYNLTDPDNQVFPGRDYTNFSKYSESNELPSEPPTNSVDRTTFPRTPWHDIACVLDGLGARDVAFNFFQKWNNAMHSIDKKEQLFLMPKSIDDKPTMTLDKNKVYTNLTLQLLRSGCDWSFGIPEVEKSIEKAYCYLIKLSQHYLYFENQYFISGVDQPQPKNRILKALYDRLKLAIVEKQQFKVIIVLPIHPAGDPKGMSTRYIMKYTYETINRKGSIVQRLNAEFPDVDLSEYINFYSLRNWAILNGNPVTEQIYIHAKLAIMDDRVAIIGSSNINDRSMVGSHDSEIGIVVQTPQDEFVPGTMNGKPFMIAKYAHDLRCRLWRDYLGLDANDTSIVDPVSNVAHGLWRKTAVQNTILYNQVFPCLPDRISCLSDYKDIIEKYGDIEILKQIKGFLVEFPLYFFQKDKLPPNPGTTIFI
jgi:phospholipase D1/2